MQQERLDPEQRYFEQEREREGRVDNDQSRCLFNSLRVRKTLANKRQSGGQSGINLLDDLQEPFFFCRELSDERENVESEYKIRLEQDG
jgi:hypothetical protein